MVLLHWWQSSYIFFQSSYLKCRTVCYVTTAEEYIKSVKVNTIDHCLLLSFHPVCQWFLLLFSGRLNVFPMYIGLLFPAWKFNHNGTNDFETKKNCNISSVGASDQSVSQCKRMNERCQSRSHINTRRISYLLSNLPHKILPYLFRLIYIVWSVSSLWLLWLSEYTVGVAWCVRADCTSRQAGAHDVCAPITKES